MIDDCLWSSGSGPVQISRAQGVQKGSAGVHLCLMIVCGPQDRSGHLLASA